MIQPFFNIVATIQYELVGALCKLNYMDLLSPDLTRCYELCYIFSQSTDRILMELYVSGVIS